MLVEFTSDQAYEVGTKVKKPDKDIVGEVDACRQTGGDTYKVRVELDDEINVSDQKPVSVGFEYMEDVDGT